MNHSSRYKPHRDWHYGGRHELVGYSDVRPIFWGVSSSVSDFVTTGIHFVQAWTSAAQAPLSDKRQHTYVIV